MPEVSTCKICGAAIVQGENGYLVMRRCYGCFADWIGSTTSAPAESSAEDS